MVLMSRHGPSAVGMFGFATPFLGRDKGARLLGNLVLRHQFCVLTGTGLRLCNVKFWCRRWHWAFGVATHFWCRDLGWPEWCRDMMLAALWPFGVATKALGCNRGRLPGHVATSACA